MRFNFYRSFHNIQFEIRVYFRHSKVTVVSVSVSVCLLCVPLSGQSRADCHRETKNNLDSNLPDLDNCFLMLTSLQSAGLAFF